MLRKVPEEPVKKTCAHLFPQQLPSLLGAPGVASLRPEGQAASQVDVGPWSLGRVTWKAHLLDVLTPAGWTIPCLAPCATAGPFAGGPHSMAHGPSPGSL